MTIIAVTGNETMYEEYRIGAITMSDRTEYISRQAAIEIASGYCHPSNIAEELAKLPSVDTVKVVRCKDCKYYHPSYCEIWSRFGTMQTREKGYCYMGERNDVRRI